jgi:fructoselysine 6-kinase
MKIAAATFGERGSLAWDGAMFHTGEAYPAEVINTVGAGDSFIAGFLHGLVRGCSLSECLRTGARIAADVVGVFEPWIVDERG